jgi:cobalamin 5'-phosphate synthase/cobalamin synthase
MRAFLAAVAFLTRVPLPARRSFESLDVGRGTLFFPLVGAAIGAVSVVALELLSMRAGGGEAPRLGSPWLPPLLVAVCLVSLTTWLTGGLHLDGLADVADGFGGGRSREEVLRIMRDPSIGAFGAMALILLLLGKVLSLGSLVERGIAIRYLMVAPALGRWSTVALGRFLPYARPEGGLGTAVTDHVRTREFLGATTLAGVISLLVGPGAAAACWGATVVMALGVGGVCRARIGGVTGDTLGAASELTEVAVLALAVAVTG